MDQFLESNPVGEAELAEIQQDLINTENESNVMEPDSALSTMDMNDGAPEEVHEDDLDMDVELADVTVPDMVDTAPIDGADDYSSAAF